jgi:putative ribosome biogenesis GTPase RsgA
MCHPAIVPLMTLAITAASTTMSVISQKQQANATEDAMKADYDNKLQAYQEQQKQITAQESNSMVDIQREAMRQQASLRVAAGESGVGGFSMLNILDDVYTQAGFESAKLQQNTDNAREQSARELQGIRANTQSGLNRIERPDYMGAGLQIAGSAVNTYARKQDLDARLKGKA